MASRPWSYRRHQLTATELLLQSAPFHLSLDSKGISSVCFSKVETAVTIWLSPPSHREPHVCYFYTSSFCSIQTSTLILKQQKKKRNKNPFRFQDILDFWLYVTWLKVLTDGDNIVTQYFTMNGGKRTTLLKTKVILTPVMRCSLSSIRTSLPSFSTAQMIEGWDGFSPLTVYITNYPSKGWWHWWLPHLRLVVSGAGIQQDLPTERRQTFI